MTLSPNAKEIVLSLIKKNKSKADYFDVRVGDSSGTYININNHKIDDVSKPKSFGGSVRVLHKGGWGTVTFNDVVNLEDSFDEALLFAKRTGNSKSVLAKAPVVVDKVTVPDVKKAFTKISLKDKVDVFKKYDRLAWSKGKKLVNVEIYYSDSLRSKLFASSEGSLIEVEEAYVSARIMVTAKSGTTIELYSDKLTDLSFADVLGKEDLVINAVKTAEKISEAPNVKSGTYDVVMDPALSGVFAHEAFGHLSEGDNAYENPQIANLMKLGTRFGSDILNISDDPTIPNQRGSYKYDDEGVTSRQAKLLENGILVGRLHSRETAGKMNEKPTGHARAESVFKFPLVRMGITYIKPGKSNFDDMIKSIKNGIYCINWQAGETDHERFTFTAGYGCQIKDGKLGSIVRNVKLTGNLFDTLKNVEMIGSDLKFEGGTCGKGGQSMPNTTGSPHIKIKNVAVIGI